MTTKTRQSSVVALAALSALIAAAAVAADWPQWMGPDRNGAVSAPGLFGGGGPVELELAWRRQLGGGYSSVSVSDGRAYTLASGEDADTLVAFDATDGAELWRYRLDAAGIEKASSTPAVGDGRVFALNGRGKLHAVTAAEGEAIWSHDLAATHGAVPPSYGMSTSPLLVDGRVVVLVGGRERHNLVAFDQETGAVDWSVFHAKRGSYASPVLLTIDGQRQIVAPADDRLYAVRPEDGSLLWSHDGLGYLDRIPLQLSSGRLFFAQETRATMLRVARGENAWRTDEMWTTGDLQNSYSPAVHHRGSIYGFNGNFLTCLDGETGETRWRHQMGLGSLVLVDGHLVVLDAASGRLTVVEARSDKYVERAAVAALQDSEKGGAYASPSYAGRRIFVRGAEEVVAVEVR